MDSKLVALIRHGEGYHNFSSRKLGFGSLYSMFRRDPLLTPLGEAQAADLRDLITKDASHPLHRVEVVISSPLTRALQTSRIIFGPGSSSPPRCVSAIHSERCIAPCDVGRPPSDLANDPLFADFQLDAWEGFADLPEVWWPQGRTLREEFWPIDRVEAFKLMLMSRPEKILAVVGHGGFFSLLTERHLKNSEVLWIQVSGPNGEVQIIEECRVSGRM